MVALKETFRNDLEDTTLEQLPEENGGIDSNPEVPETEPEESDTPVVKIVGPEVVYPYDKKKYTIENATGGYWIIDNEKKAVITHQSSKTATVEFITGRSGEISLTYKRDNEEDIVLQVRIASL